MIENTNTSEEIDDILQRMYDRHQFMIKKYYLCPLDFRTETPEQFVKNRCEEVEFHIKNNTFDYDVKIKQTCWINQEKYTCYFKTKFYINGQLTKKNIRFLRDILDFLWFEETEVTYPLPVKEEDNKEIKKNTKKNKVEQLSLFDFIE
jgi:hypothetical protein